MRCDDVGGRGEDLLVVGDAARTRASSLQFASEVTQIAIRELDGQFVTAWCPPGRERLLAGPEPVNASRSVLDAPMRYNVAPEGKSGWR